MDVQNNHRLPAVPRSRLEWNKRVSRLHGLPVMYWTRSNSTDSREWPNFYFIFNVMICERQGEGGVVGLTHRPEVSPGYQINVQVGGGPNGILDCHGEKGRWHAVDQTKFPFRPLPFQAGWCSVFPFSSSSSLFLSYLSILLRNLDRLWGGGGFVTFSVDRTKIPGHKPIVILLLHIYPSVRKKERTGFILRITTGKIQRIYTYPAVA